MTKRKVPSRIQEDLPDYEIEIQDRVATIRQYHFSKDIPLESVEGFIQDITEDYSELPLSGDPDVDSVIKGTATFLGKGMDGIVFRSKSGRVVKISTTVPFHPMHHEHRTPQEAIEHTRKEAELLLALQEIHCIPKIDYLEWGGRAWIVKPYLELLDETDLSQSEVDEIESCLRALHKAGYSLGDTLQFGVGADGNVYFLDLGQARSDAHSMDSDMEHLRYAAKQSGRELRSDEAKTEALQLKFKNLLVIAKFLSFDPDRMRQDLKFLSKVQDLDQMYQSLSNSLKRRNGNVGEFIEDLVIAGVLDT